jgi:predicted SAM-dependent methyltransferase
LTAIPPGVWLNVGSGPSNPAGWLNLDGSWQARLAGHAWLARVGRAMLGTDIGHWPRGVQHWDIRRGLPHGSGPVAVVYASHVLEHLHRATVRFLTHARTRLAPGGVCRVVVSDLRAIVGWYLEHRDGQAGSSSDLLMEMMMLRPRDTATGNRILGIVRRATDLHEHKWMYDQTGLLAVFHEAGFAHAAARQYLESAIPIERLEQVERADRLRGGAGVCVEAIK